MVGILDSDFVDDVVFLLADLDPELVIAKAGFLLDIIAEEFHKAGFDLNLAAGKTEAVVTLIGKESRRVQQCLKQHDGGPRLVSFSGQRSCGLVQQYKHLGTVRRANGSSKPACSERVRLANLRYIQLAYHVFANAVLSVALRLHLASSLVVSVFFFGVETWENCDYEVMRMLNGARMRVLRRIRGGPRYKATDNTTDSQVLEHFNLSITDVLILQKRLTCLASLASPASPPALLALLSCTHCTKWGVTWANDARWMSTRCEEKAGPFDGNPA